MCSKRFQSGGPFWKGKPLPTPKFDHFVLGSHSLGFNGYYFVEVYCGRFKCGVKLADNNNAKFLREVQRLEAVLKGGPAGDEGNLEEV